MTQKTKIEQYNTHPQIQKPKLGGGGGGGVNASAPGRVGSSCPTRDIGRGALFKNPMILNRSL